MSSLKKTKIVCTIGPATESVETLKELLNRGMNVMRLNFSHGDYEEHGMRIKNFRHSLSKILNSHSMLFIITMREI